MKLEHLKDTKISLSFRCGKVFRDIYIEYRDKKLIFKALDKIKPIEPIIGI